MQNAYYGAYTFHNPHIFKNINLPLLSSKFQITHFFTLSTISTLRPPQKTSTLLKTPVPSPSPSTLPASLYSPYQSSQPLNSGLNFRTWNLSVANVKYSKQNALTVFELVLENFAFTRRAGSLSMGFAPNT